MKTRSRWFHSATCWNHIDTFRCQLRMLALDMEKEKKESCLGQLSSKVMFNNRPQGHKLKITDDKRWKSYIKKNEKVIALKQHYSPKHSAIRSQRPRKGHLAWGLQNYGRQLSLDFLVLEGHGEQCYYELIRNRNSKYIRWGAAIHMWIIKILRWTDGIKKIKRTIT